SDQLGDQITVGRQGVVRTHGARMLAVVVHRANDDPWIPDERGRARTQSDSTGVAPQPSFCGRSMTRATTEAIFDPNPELFQSVNRQQPAEGKRSCVCPPLTSGVENEPGPSSRRARSVPGLF